MGALLRMLGFINVRFVWNYRGHNRGLFQRGPNWWQITVPPNRKLRRCALIVTTARVASSRARDGGGQ